MRTHRWHMAQRRNDVGQRREQRRNVHQRVIELLRLAAVVPHAVRQQAIEQTVQLAGAPKALHGRSKAAEAANGGRHGVHRRVVRLELAQKLRSGGRRR